MEPLFIILLACGAVWFFAKVIVPIIGGVMKASGNVFIMLLQLAFCGFALFLIIGAMN